MGASWFTMIWSAFITCCFSSKVYFWVTIGITSVLIWWSMVMAIFLDFADHKLLKILLTVHVKMQTKIVNVCSFHSLTSKLPSLIHISLLLPGLWRRRRSQHASEAFTWDTNKVWCWRKSGCCCKSFYSKIWLHWYPREFMVWKTRFSWFRKNWGYSSWWCHAGNQPPQPPPPNLYVDLIFHDFILNDDLEKNWFPNWDLLR